MLYSSTVITSNTCSNKTIRSTSQLFSFIEDVNVRKICRKKKKQKKNLFFQIYLKETIFNYS